MPLESSIPVPFSSQLSSTFRTSVVPATKTMMQNNYERSATAYQPVVQISTLARPAHMRMTPSLELRCSLCSDFRWKAWVPGNRKFEISDFIFSNIQMPSMIETQFRRDPTRPSMKKPWPFLNPFTSHRRWNMV